MKKLTNIECYGYSLYYYISQYMDIFIPLIYSPPPGVFFSKGGVAFTILKGLLYYSLSSNLRPKYRIASYIKVYSFTGM